LKRISLVEEAGLQGDAGDGDKVHVSVGGEEDGWMRGMQLKFNEI
jgi:hypothetical protein